MSLSLLIVAALAATVVAAEDVTPCKFTANGLRYDLCEMFKATPMQLWRSEATPPTVTSTMYTLSLNGPIKINSSLPLEEQCPEGTWICSKTYNSLPDKEDRRSRLTQLIPVAASTHLAPEGEEGPSFADTRNHLNITTALGRQPSAEKHPPLDLVLHGGMYVKAKQVAYIQLWCDEEVKGIGRPTIGYHAYGWHTFNWRTSKACATNGYNRHDHKPSDDASRDPVPKLPLPQKPSLDTQSHSTLFWLGSIALVGVVCHFVYNFMKRGGSLPFDASILAAIPAFILTAPISLLRAAQACISGRRRSPAAERQLLFADEIVDIDDLDQLPSPSRAKFTQSYSSYGIAQPYSPLPGSQPQGSASRLQKMMRSLRSWF